MNSKLLIGALVGAVASFLLGWVVYGMLLKNFFIENTTAYEGLQKNPPVLLAIFLGGLCMTTLLAWIFSKTGVNTFMKGATAGLLVGLLVGLWYYFGSYAFWNLYTTNLMVIDVFVNAIFYAAVGGITASAMGMGKKSAVAGA